MSFLGEEDFGEIVEGGRRHGKGVGLGFNKIGKKIIFDYFRVDKVVLLD